MLNLVLAVALSTGSGGAELAKGQIVDEVACLDDPEQTYALYLPSHYVGERTWPVIIALDPAARGRAPLERFAAAAEALGYVLVGSHNSRNGPLEPTIQTLGAIWNDLGRRFAIDPQRIYLAGFSGGARMASQLAQQSIVAGVIACGAGLLQGDAQRFPFVYAATAGHRDFNYLEVRVLVENLQKRGTRATFMEFDGGHDWPPEAVAWQVLEWVKAQSMRDRLEPPDREWLETYLQSRIQHARGLDREGQAYAALQAHESLARDFEGLLPLGEVEARLDLLRNDPRARETRRQRERTDQVERREIRVVMDQVLAERPSKSQKWWARKLESYRQLGKKDLFDAANLSQRLQQLVFSNAIEKAWFAAEEKDFTRALWLTGIAIVARPESAELRYRRARLQALTGHLEEALADLEKARDLGFQDRARWLADEAFRKLRDDPRFGQFWPPEPSEVKPGMPRGSNSSGDHQF